MKEVKSTKSKKTFICKKIGCEIKEFESNEYKFIKGEYLETCPECDEECVNVFGIDVYTKFKILWASVIFICLVRMIGGYLGYWEMTEEMYGAGFTVIGMMVFSWLVSNWFDWIGTINFNKR